jgi:two-component system sensor histidine kinase AlgZ
VSLSDARAQISLREELEVARIYQRIEQLRLGDRLQVRWKVADLPPDAIVPSLLLQPLLETAIGHGIEPLPEGGTVLVEGRNDGEQVVIEISNPVSATAKAVRSGNRMALDNIRQRLNMRDFMDTLRGSGIDTGGPAALGQAERMAEFVKQR